MERRSSSVGDGESFHSQDCSGLRGAQQIPLREHMNPFTLCVSVAPGKTRAGQGIDLIIRGESTFHNAITAASRGAQVWDVWDDVQCRP